MTYPVSQILNLLPGKWFVQHFMRHEFHESTRIQSVKIREIRVKIFHASFPYFQLCGQIHATASNTKIVLIPPIITRTPSHAPPSMSGPIVAVAILKRGRDGSLIVRAARHKSNRTGTMLASQGRLLDPIKFRARLAAVSLDVWCKAALPPIAFFPRGTNAKQSPPDALPASPAAAS